MTGQPEPEDLTGYLEPDPPIGCLNLAADAAWTPPPPGSTREQLPDHLLALLDIPPYTSTACETAGLLSREMVKHTHRRIELGEHCDRLHERCRRNQKFTGALCACFCHDGQAAPEPAATEATDGQACDPELTAEEARALVQELGTDLYRAQDALAFVEECCVIADREGSPVTTAQVREWLKGAQCGRQLVAEHPDIVRDLTAALRERRPDPEADTEQPARTTGNNPPTAPAP